MKSLYLMNKKALKKQITIIFIFALVILILGCVSATGVTTCTSLGTGTFELLNDINCPNDGIQLKGNNTVFDCQGHTINYSSSGAENDRGIEFWGPLSNITVKNCIVKMTNTTSANLYRQGITIYDNSNATIYNTTVEIWGDYIGIEAWGASGPTMNNLNISSVNVISHNGDGIGIEDYAQNAVVENSNITADGWGVFTWTGANNMKIINNRINATNPTYGAGIYLQGTISGTNITGNTIYSEYNGITILSSATQTNVTNNQLLKSANRGMSIESSGNVLSGNTISGAGVYGLYFTSSGTNVSTSVISSTNYNMYLTASADSIRVVNSNFSRASGSVIYFASGSDNEYFDNVNIYSGTARGFYFAGTSNNLTIINSNFSTDLEAIFQETGGTGYNLTNNVVNSGGIGFYLINVNTSYINKNNITTTTDDGYGIYLTGTSNFIDGDIIRTSGLSAIGIVFAGATNSNVSNVDIDVSGAGSYGLYISNGATGIDLSNSTIVTRGSGFAPAVYIYGSNNNVTNVNGTTYGGDGTPGYGNYPFAFWIGYSDTSYIRDSVFNAVNADDIGAKGSAGYTSYLINVSYNELSFSPDKNQSLKFYWYMDTQVKNSTNSPIENANVTIYDINDNPIYSELTNSNGDITQQVVKAFLITNGTTQTDYTPHNITVTKTAYYTNSSIFNLTLLKDNVFWSGILTEELPTDSTPPKWFSNSTNTTIAGTLIKHSVNWTDETALSGYIFEFDNGNGTAYNNSWASFTGTTNWSNISRIVNSTGGSNIKWRIYANDTANNKNQTSIFQYITTIINYNYSVNITDYISYSDSKSTKRNYNRSSNQEISSDTFLSKIFSTFRNPTLKAIYLQEQTSLKD